MKRCLRIVSALVISYFVMQNMLFAQSTSCSNPLQAQLGSNYQKDIDSICFYEYIATSDGTIEISTCNAPTFASIYIDNSSNTFEDDCNTPFHNVMSISCGTSGQQIYILNNCLKGHKYIFGIQSWDFQNKVPVAFNWTLSENVPHAIIQLNFDYMRPIPVGMSANMSNNSINYDGGGCYWNSGDGKDTNSCTSVMHTFKSAGTFNVELTVKNGTQSSTDIKTVNVIDISNISLNAINGTNYFNPTSSTQSNGGQYYTYTASTTGTVELSLCDVSQNISGSISNVYIKSTDGSINSVYTYNPTTCPNGLLTTVFNCNQGQVFYFVVNGWDISNNIQKYFPWSLTETTMSPVTKIGYNGSDTVSINKDIFFNNNSQYSDFKSCIWNFGDGSTMNNCSPNVTHRYSQVGTYKIRLTTFNGSLQSSDSLYITTKDMVIKAIPAFVGGNIFPIAIASQGNGVKYTYTATKNGKFVISLCNVPKTYNPQITLIPPSGSGTNPPSYFRNCTNQNNELVLSMTAGQSISFTIDGKDLVNNVYVPFTWYLNEEGFAPGEDCSTALSAQIGTNNVMPVQNSSPTLFYSYTPSSRSKVVISLCGIPSSISANVFIAGSCSTSGNNPQLISYSCSNSQMQYSIEAQAGQPIVFGINGKDVTNNNLISFSYQLNENSYKDGDVCDKPIIATNGVNSYIYNTGNMNGSQKYYTYTAKEKGRIIISLCDLPDTIYANVNQVSHTQCSNYMTQGTANPVSDYINTQYTSCGSHSKILFDCNAGETFYFPLYGNNSFNWTLNEIPILQGEECSNPIVAKKGVNLANWQFKASAWYVYTAPANGAITVSNCGNTFENTSVLITSGCSMQMLGYNNDSCNLQSQKSIQVESGKQYYIWWFKEEINSGTTTITPFIPTAFQWNLEFNEGKVLPDGGSCSTPIIAKSVNTISSIPGGIVWYSFTATQTGKAAISFKREVLSSSLQLDLKSMKNCMISNGNDDMYLNFEDTSAYIYATKGETYQIAFMFGSANTSSLTFDWYLSETAQAIPSGAICTLSKKIKTGTYTISNTIGRDWYNFEAPVNGTLYLKYSSANNNNQNNGVFSIVDNCDGNPIASSNINGELSYHMKASEARNILYNNIKNKANIIWQLSFVPDNDVNISNFVVYGTNNEQVMAQSAIIDQINKTIVVKVGNQVDVSKSYFTTISVDQGVKVNNIAGQKYYDNIMVSYNNPTAIMVSSPDGLTNVTWNVFIEKLTILHSTTKILSFTIGGQKATLFNDSIFVATLDWSTQNNSLNYKIVADTMVTMQFASGSINSPDGWAQLNIDRPDTNVVYTLSEDGTKQDRYIFIVKRANVPVGGFCSNAIQLQKGSNTITNNTSNSVWVTFTATSDAFIQIAYPNTQWASISQYQGTDCSQMTNSSSNDLTEQIPYAFRVNKGMTYYFQVHSSLPDYILSVSETKARTGNKITNVSVGNTIVVQQYIDSLNNKISITIPYSAEASNISATLQISDGASLMVGTLNSNYLYINLGENPITVVAENGDIAKWNIIVNKAPANSEANFLSFILPEQIENPIIDIATQKINVKVDPTTIVSKSIPYFIVSNGATVYIENVQQMSGSSLVDFTTTVTYVVVSEDLSNYTKWTVSISGGITEIPVSYISFPQTLYTIDEGQTLTINPIIAPTNATIKNLTWSIDNPASVGLVNVCNPCVSNFNAMISGIAPGFSYIKVTAVNGVTNTIGVQVNAKITRVKSVVLSTHTLSLTVGEKYQFTAQVYPTDANNQTVIWQASNKNISFDQTGTIGADVSGTSKIYAISADNKAILDSCVITISTKYTPLTKIDILPVELKMNVNSTVTPQVVYTPTTFSSSDLMWWSDDPTIAVVDAKGTITTTSKAGQAKVFAGSTSNTTIFDVVLVTSSTISVTGITLFQTVVQMEVGQSSVINVASILPINATLPGCTWSIATGTTQIAKIDKQSYTGCTIIGLTEGKATLIATSLDGNAVASCAIYVLPVSVKSITVTPTFINTFVGDVPFTITSAIMPTNASNQTVTITNSSANKITSILTTGQIKPIAAGIDTIKIQSVSNPNVFATCIVLVSNTQIALKSIQLYDSEVNVSTSSTYQLIYNFDPSNATNKDVVFSSSDVSVATVSQTGIITTSKVIGKAYIIVTSATNKLIGDTLLLHNNGILASSVKIDNKSLIIPVGGSAKINAYINPTNVTNTIVSWKMLDLGVVSMQSSGNLLYVTGLTKGTARIVASIDNVSDTCYVQITPIMIQSVGLNVSAMSMKVGDIKPISATITPTTAENTTLIWTSSSQNVATIDALGKITAVGVGTTTISVSPQTNANLVASCIVTVSSSETVLTQISIVDADLTTKLDVIKVDALSKKQLFVSFIPIAATYKDIIWSSSSSLTSVDASGIVVTGNAVDTAIITATSVKYSSILSKVKVITSNIKPIQITGIVIESQVAINNNETRLLKREILPTTATNKTINWISSNPNVVTVDKYGAIKGVNPGFAVVYAQATDFQAVKSNECFVMVNEVPVTGITINVEGVLSMKESSVDNSIMATITPSNATNKKILWVSSNSGSVIVDTAGVITTLRAGVAIVYAIAKNNPAVRDSFIVEVTKPLADKSNLAYVLLEAKAKLTFINDNSLTGNKPGQYPTSAVLAFYNASVSAKLVYEKILSSQYEVDSTAGALKMAFIALENSKIGYTAVNKVTIIRDSVIVKINETTSNLKAYVYPETATNKLVDWSSTNANVVEVDINGVLIPRNPGIAYVYANSSDNAAAFDSCKIIVIAPVQQIVLPSIFSLVDGETNSIPFTVIPENATNQDLIWTISDTSYAENDNNMIWAKKVGYAKVIVSTADKSITAVCVLAITSSQIPVTGITVQPKVALLNGTSVAIKASVEPINATNQNIYWSISNQDIATVNEYGVISANSVGTTTLFAISQDGNFIDTTEVLVYPSLSPVIVNIPALNIKSGTDGISFDLAKYIVDDNTSIENLIITVAKLTGFTYDLTGTVLSIIPKPSFTSGTETVKISVTDRDGQTTTVSFKVTVSTLQNTKPVVAKIPSQQIKTGDVFSPIVLTQYVSDDYTPADSILWSVKSSSNIASYVYAGYAKFELLNTAFTGTDSLWVIAQDAGGLKDSVRIGFTVSKVANTAPTVLAIPVQIQNATVQFGQIDLNEFVSDDYTLPTNIKWSTSVSTKLNISIVNNIAYLAVIDQNWMGGESITFTATDEDGLFTDTKVTFDQELNMSSSWPTKPLVNFYAENQVVGVGEAVSFHSSLTGAKSWIWDFEAGTTPNLSKANPEVTYSKPGNYTVKLFAQNTYGLDSLVIEKYISVVGIIEDSIVVCKGNSATIHTSTSGLGYKWSNSLTSQDITVTPSTSTTYSVTISNGLFKYYDNVVVKVKQPVNLGSDIALCTGETKIVQPTTIPGTSFISYSWNPTSASNSISVTSGGTYSVTATDDDGCITSDAIVVTQNALPTVSLGANDSICPTTPKVLNAGTGLSSYAWSTGVTAQTITVTATGKYIVTVVDANGCKNTSSVTIVVRQPYAEELGVATVLGKNRIVLAWIRSKDMNTSSYTVLKETTFANVWEPVGTRLISDTSYIVDYNVDPMQQTYRYKLQTTDKCQSKVESTPHRTMLLQAGYSESTNSNQLNWNGYEGIALSTYKIYRNDTLIKSIAASASNGSYLYNDTDGKKGDVYRVEYDLPATVVTTLLKSDSGPYSQSLSNMAESELTGTSIFELNADVTAYPNPSNGKFTVKIVSTKASKYTVTVSNILGQEVLSTQTAKTSDSSVLIDLNASQNGMYLIKVESEGKVITKSIMINK